MKCDPKKHHRRSIRVADYDYAHVGAYFVTVCTEDHTCLLGDLMDGEMRLNDAGRMVQTLWDELPDHSPGVETDAFVVMPNRIHAIIVLSPDPVGAGPRACPDPIGQPQGVAPTSQIQVEIKGLDVYDPTTGAIRSSSTDDIACWFIDTNYNQESFFVRHAYFTGAEEPSEGK